MIKKFNIILLLFTAITLTVLPSTVYALENPGENLDRIGVSVELGTNITPTLEFKDMNDRSVKLGDFLRSGKPLIVVPAYYDCPRLCGLLMDGVKRLISSLTLELGKDFNVVTVSFNPADTPEKAGKIHQQYTKDLLADLPGGKGDISAWHFLVGDENQTSSLMRELGFKYEEDKEDFIHTAAIFILTPEGQIAQYFTDIQFSPRDVRLSLVEAGEGRIGNFIDQVMLFCFRFDPTKGKYTLAAFNFIRTGGLITLLGLLALFFYLRRRESNSSKA